MKWIYSINQKMKIASLLGGVMFIIIISNVFISRNEIAIQKSFSSVVKDRLIVESYIYQLSEQLYEKKLKLENCYTQTDINGTLCNFTEHNESIQQLLTDYGTTFLTEEESLYFYELNQNINSIVRLENNYLREYAASHAEVQETMKELYSLALQNLHLLSDIQISEGQILNEESNQIFANNKLFGQLELIMLLFIGFLIQSIVFASKTLKTNLIKQPSLN